MSRFPTERTAGLLLLLGFLLPVEPQRGHNCSRNSRAVQKMPKEICDSHSPIKGALSQKGPIPSQAPCDFRKGEPSRTHTLDSARDSAPGGNTRHLPVTSTKHFVTKRVRKEDLGCLSPTSSSAGPFALSDPSHGARRLGTQEAIFQGLSSLQWHPFSPLLRPMRCLVWDVLATSKNKWKILRMSGRACLVLAGLPAKPHVAASNGEEFKAATDSSMHRTWRNSPHELALI